MLEQHGSRRGSFSVADFAPACAFAATSRRTSGDPAGGTAEIEV
jgi:hypothetical protein